MAKILIIEDDPFLRKVYNNVLTKEGFDVEIASEGNEGLMKAEANEPDLIMLDMLMPGLDGIAFLQKYEPKTRHPNVKIIVFSNVTVEDKVNEAIALGATNYKTKAFFTPKAMTALIRDTLAN